MAFVGEFQHTSLWKIYFSQCSTLLVGMRFSIHVPNSPRDKNKMMHHPCLLEKVNFLASKTPMSPIGIGKKFFISTLNFMVLQMVRNECVEFGRSVERQVNYKILYRLKSQIMLKICTIYLAFDRGSFEVVLIENTCRTLRVNYARLNPSHIVFVIPRKKNTTNSTLMTYTLSLNP
jgi:hypothetical protein